MKNFYENYEAIFSCKLTSDNQNIKKSIDKKEMKLDGPWNLLAIDLSNEIQQVLENVENYEKVSSDLKEQVNFQDIYFSNYNIKLLLNIIFLYLLI